MHETHKSNCRTIRKFNDFLKYDDLSVATLLGLWFNKYMIRFTYFSRNYKNVHLKWAYCVGFAKFDFLLNFECNFKIYSKTKWNAGKGHNCNTINLKLMIKRFVIWMKCCINTTIARKASTILNLLLSRQGALYSH